MLILALFRGSYSLPGPCCQRLQSAPLCLQEVTLCPCILTFDSMPPLLNSDQISCKKFSLSISAICEFLRRAQPCGYHSG